MFALTLIEISLIVIWLLGVATGLTFGGLIHVILGIAILLIISRLIAGGSGSSGDNGDF